MLDFDKYYAYKHKKLTCDDEEKMYELCSKNKKYYEYMNEKVDVKSILNDLPPNTSYDDKFCIGFYDDNNKLVAILDLVKNYPGENSAFIGLLIVDLEVQGKGIGKNIVESTIKMLKDYGIKCCQLGCIEDNKEAINFWQKVGFKFTGVSYNHEKYNVLMMYRSV